MARRVAIVGGGWAGLACAVELADADIEVDVFEASRTLGGRARAVQADGLTLDNGAHLLAGAYRETLRLIEKVGAGRTALRRLPLHLEFPGGFRLAAPGLPLPAPLRLACTLLTAQGLRGEDKLAALRFLRALKKTHFRLPRDFPASRLIGNQPLVLRRYLWGPLCLAALNTPIREASAQIFLNVLRDTLAAGRGASDLLLPATDLTRLFPEPAARFIETRGGKVHRATRVRNLDMLADYDHRVLAVAPWHLPALAPQIGLPEFAWQPIATIYLHYPEGVHLAFPLLGLDNGHG
ncbi:MAG: FAD-dependent oxidoreductase, partial [Rhodocyclaceae bacterium]